MTSRIKIFIVVFLLSLPFWWGIDNLSQKLDNFFFYYQLSKTPQIFTAEINPQIKKADVDLLQLSAKSALSVWLDKRGREKILFAEEAKTKLPIASLTKLMTALIVLDNYDLTKEIKISQEAVNQEGDFGQLQISRVYSAEYLLYPLLMESSNDAAFALAQDYEGMNLEKFLGLMNQKAQSLGMENTYFFNPTGLEPDEDKNAVSLNYSTAQDLVKLTKELLKKPFLWQILSLPQYSLYGPELKSTDNLLFDETIDWRDKIVGGKTGYTMQAGGCILLVLEAPENKGYLINVILGTANNNERFNQMKNLITWLNTAYIW